MNNRISETAAGALALAGDAASRLRKDVSRWVPTAVKAIGAGTTLVGLRDGSRNITRAARRNPATTAAAVTVAVGAGVALWLLRRNKQRRGLDEKMQTIEVEAVRVEPKPATRRAARKAASTRKRAQPATE